MVVIQGRVQDKNDDMARTKTITVPATQKPATRSTTTAIPMSQTALHVPEQSVSNSPGRDTTGERPRTNDGDKETKGDNDDTDVQLDPETGGSQDNPTTDTPPTTKRPVMNANTSTGAATTTATATEGEMTALSAVLLQVSETMNRMTARLDNLEMAVATTMSQATPAGSARTTTGTTNAVTAPTVDTRHVTYRRSTDGGDGGDSSSSEDLDSSDDDDNGDSAGDSHGIGAGRVSRERSMVPTSRHGRRKNVRDLELTPFQPLPNNSVSTWIQKVDLALDDDAARFWVQVDQGMRPEMRTWSYLKAALERRYGGRPDKSQAELRVNQRFLMPGETFADFAAGLRDARGENKVSKRVLLAQFIRNLPKTIRQLVRESKPKTLDEAVDKATEVDDPFDNVAQGMKNIGQEWVTAQMAYPVAVGAASGHPVVIPGVGGRDATRTTAMAVPTDPEWAIFSNPQGVWNKFTGVWDIPEGRVWNGRYWAVRPNRKRMTKPAVEDSVTKTPAVAKTEKKSVAKVRMVRVEDSNDEETSHDPHHTGDGTTTTAGRDTTNSSTHGPSGVLRLWKAWSLRKRMPGYGSEGTQRRLPGGTHAEAPGEGKRRTGAVGGFRRPVEQERPQQTEETDDDGNQEEKKKPLVIDDVEDECAVTNDRTVRTDGSIAAVQTTIGAQLDSELGARDEHRAARYVSTVRPAMAALRYGRKRKEERQSEVRSTEEGGSRMTDERQAEEGAAPDNEHEGGSTTVALDDKMVVDEAETPDPTEPHWKTTAAVDTLSKTTAIGVDDDEVERAVTELEAETRARRRQQEVDARRELAERWKRGGGSAAQDETGRVNVNLV
ncbi:hypothetical protein F442_14478 [Phytophthora nicotianae P10297]|uniref:Retrotransposon gag domain-containing protein n=1 Tax=Phytophthora nicotianae P10297 TaxID=1317064 RepID=W2YRX8_PHYNI|nr:hypothetical protein F442_14478 [Phytophthora nicotianae P10297]